MCLEDPMPHDAEEGMLAHGPTWALIRDKKNFSSFGVGHAIAVVYG